MKSRNGIPAGQHERVSEAIGTSRSMPHCAVRILTMSLSPWKRVSDCLLAAALLAVTAPLWVIIILSLLLTQGLPFWYRQRRVGLHGQVFTLVKFRTMTAGSPPRLPDRPVAKTPADPRITPLGRLLRRLALDELPQLINVLSGEMSLVGPRPLPEADLQEAGWLTLVDEGERARRLAWLATRQQVRPGLTGLWQISRNPEADFDNWIVCDETYVATHSWHLDLWILLLTPWAVLRGRQ